MRILKIYKEETKTMKKISVMLTIAALSVLFIAGCAPKQETTEQAAPEVTAPAEQAAPAVATPAAEVAPAEVATPAAEAAPEAAPAK